jgi:hypothetical protein
MAALEKWRRLGYAAVLVQGGAAQGERTGVRVYPWWWL